MRHVFAWARAVCLVTLLASCASNPAAAQQGQAPAMPPLPQSSPARSPQAPSAAPSSTVSAVPSSALHSPPGTPSPTPAQAGARSLWVWTTPDNATLINFAKTHGISEIFYSVSPSVNAAGAENTRVSDLRSRAVAAGIKLDALGGDPSWADNGAGTQEAISWENSAMGTGLFAGAHFDIEPNPPVVAACDMTEAGTFLAALDSIHRNGMGHGWNMNEDTQFGDRDCTGVDGYPTMIDGIVARTDQVTVMSYRNVASGGNGIWDICQDTIARAHAAGKPARCGAETNKFTPASITFYGSTATHMAGVLSQVDSLALQSSSASSYRGIAIEDYAGYSALAP